ncbi:MAG: hypothetical protein SGI77_13990 [Pirellulaceae bacterium]|nr:hypothetical protein [Pirellulaceae bacterium]
MEPQQSSQSETNSQSYEEAPSRSKLLDELLESTLSQRGKSLLGEEWELLREIANKADQDGVNFVEIATQIIEAFLFQRFPKTLSNQASLHRMSENIAQTLCEDPTSKQRLTEFVQHLRNPNRGE